MSFLEKKPDNCLYFDLVGPKNGSIWIERNFYRLGDRSMLYMCNLLCSALFEIVMDNSKMPIVLYKEPEPNTSNAVTESDTQSTLNE